MNYTSNEVQIRPSAHVLDLKPERKLIDDYIPNKNLVDGLRIRKVTMLGNILHHFKKTAATRYITTRRVRIKR